MSGLEVGGAVCREQAVGEGRVYVDSLQLLNSRVDEPWTLVWAWQRRWRAFRYWINPPGLEVARPLACHDTMRRADA